MSKYIPLKYYFDKELACQLANSIYSYDASFRKESFVETVANEVNNKELKARVEVIANALRQHLSPNYEEALEILMKILGPENETEEGMFTKGYFLMPVAYFVERYGLDHFDVSLRAMYEITKRHTSEYAIRPYLLKDTERCMVYFQEWIKDANSHVRRLVSEGTRPRLPWAKKISPIKNDVQNNLHLLKELITQLSHHKISP